MTEQGPKASGREASGQGVSGPATSTGSLASQRHPGKFPKVPGRRRGTRGFPAATRERPRESFFKGSGAGTLGVPLEGTRRVGALLGVAGRLSGTVSPFRAEQGTEPRVAPATWPQSGGEKGLRRSGAGTLGVPLGGTRRVGALLGVAGRLSGILLPGKSHGQRSLVGYSPWACKNLTQLSN